MDPSPPRAVWTALLLAGALCLAGGVSAVEPATPAASGVYDLVEQGRQALVADQYAEASKLFEQAMRRPEFANTDPKLQYFAFLLAAFAAEGTKDNLTAHEFLVIATSHPAADGEVWMRRARAALILEKWSDAGLALTTVAKQWPKELDGDDFQGWVINKTVRELGNEAALRPQRTELLDALFEAGYKSEFGIEPSHLWLSLAIDALDRQDLKRAREISRRITDNSVLISMRIDKRFDALTAAEPRLFDVRAAAERQAKTLKGVMKGKPKSLGAVVQYGYALYTLGRFEELLSLANTTIDKIEKAPQSAPPYVDLDESLNWIHNHKALALGALGRWEDGAEVLASWERSERNKEDKVSQAINLGSYYNEMGRPDDALKAVDGLDWSRGMSDYGRMQCQQVRFQAYLQKKMDSQVQEIVEWMREHRADSMETAQSALLEAGDTEGAAALLVSRLRNAEERTAALAEIQNYARTPRTERGKKRDELKEALLARTDVAVAIAEFGRREKFPVYSILY